MSLHNNLDVMNIREAKYYCQNCSAQIKSTDTMCPKCGKNLAEVGKRTEVTFTEVAGEVVLSSFEVPKLNIKQRKILDSILCAAKGYLSSKEIESITIGFPQLISIKIKSKKDKENLPLFQKRAKRTD